MTIIAVIMAGGRGERLWPKSTANRPKQFQSFAGGKTLLQESAERISHLVPWSQVYVVTGRQYSATVYSQLPSVPKENVILEPVGRDTAPCIGYAALHVEKKFPGATMLVLPADHYVGDDEEFVDILKAATEAAQRDHALVTVGLKPTRPETGYGYIQVGLETCRFGHRLLHRVSRFVEKPPFERAVRLYQDGQHLWNSGMFIWRVEVIRSAIAMYLPELHQGLEEIKVAVGTPAEQAVVEQLFPRLPKVSIDFGVMEKADRVLVVPASFPWDDLGNWVALDRASSRGDAGNNLSGQVGTIDTHNSIIHDDDGITVTVGVKDLIIVRSGGSLLVCDKARAQDVKKAAALADELGGDPDYPVDYRIVEKPWGREIWWGVTEAYVGKILEVRAGHSLSLQYHRQKLETMFFQKGRGTLILDEKELTIQPGMAVTIRPGTVHKIVAESDLTILEVSTTELDDVVRLQDTYGRAQTEVPVTPEPQK